METLMNYFYDLYFLFSGFCNRVRIEDPINIFISASVLIVMCVIIYLILFILIYKRSGRYIRVAISLFTLLLILFSIDVAYRVYNWDNFSSVSVLNVTDSNYKLLFHDRNNIHLPEARKYGIKPIANRDELSKVKKSLVRVSNNEYYMVAHLTHSMPYLLPEVEQFLSEVGENFQDSLQSKNLPKYKIVVTSLLRSLDDVNKLRQKGAPYAPGKASPHTMATTFDIATNSYYRVDSRSASVSDLTFVLAQVLNDLRKQKKCYVLYEYTGCFHITKRK